MAKQRFQNKISKSSLTLPVCMVMGTLVWFWNMAHRHLPLDVENIAALLAAMATAYVVMETANRYALLRVRSNMVVAVWIVGIVLMPFLHHWNAGWVAAMALAGSHYVLFGTYQDTQGAIVPIFHAFVLLGVAVLAVPQTIVLVPLMYWHLLVFMRCMSWRGMWAGVVGLLLPLCIVVGWSIVANDYSFLYGRYEDLVSSTPVAGQDYGWLADYRSGRTLALGLFTLLSLVGIVHYLRCYYDDKIRTRMYLYIYCLQTAACWLLIVCLPSHIDLLLPSLMLGSSVMVAHFFALSHSWVSNAFFCLVLLGVVALTLINMDVWMY